AELTIPRCDMPTNAAVCETAWAWAGGAFKESSRRLPVSAAEGMAQARARRVDRSNRYNLGDGPSAARRGRRLLAQVPLGVVPEVPAASAGGRGRRPAHGTAAREGPRTGLDDPRAGRDAGSRASVR